jgi:hypothetical protein
VGGKISSFSRKPPLPPVCIKYTPITSLRGGRFSRGCLAPFTSSFHTRSDCRLNQPGETRSLPDRGPPLNCLKDRAQGMYPPPVASCYRPPPSPPLHLSSFSQDTHNWIIRLRRQQINTSFYTEQYLKSIRQEGGLASFIHCQHAGGENTYPSLWSQSIWTDGTSSIKELRQQPAQQAGLPLGLEFNKLS